MSLSNTAQLLTVIAVLGAPLTASAFSTFAGSCKHAGVNHGLDKFEAQSGDGGYSLSLSKPVSELSPGSTVNVRLSGSAPYKGLLLFAQVNGAPGGSWSGTLPEGLQTHPSCKHAVTHTTYHLSPPHTEDEAPWLVPVSWEPGTPLTFKATIVQNYATWYAFEHTFSNGDMGGGGGGGGGTPQLQQAHAFAGDADAQGSGSTRGGGVGSAAPHRLSPAELLAAKAAEAHGAPQVARLSGEEGGRMHAPGGGGGDGDGRGGGSHAASRAAVEAEEAEEDAQGEALLTRRRRIKLAHGTAMLAAWALLAPVGALTARFGKAHGAVWFDVHRAAQTACVALTLAGTALALVYVHPASSFSALGPHGQLGVLTTAAAAFQPLNAYFRPGKSGGRARVQWELMHKGLGWGALAGGLGNCAIGLRLMRAEEGAAAGNAMLLCAGVCLCGVYICMARFRAVTRLLRRGHLLGGGAPVKLQSSKAAQ